MKAKKVVGKSFGLVPEKLSQASPSRPACSECGLHEKCTAPFLTPYVPENWTGQYAFVLDTSVSGEEASLRSGVPLGQSERKELKKILENTGIERTQVAFIPALR